MTWQILRDTVLYINLAYLCLSYCSVLSLSASQLCLVYMLCTCPYNLNMVDTECEIWEDPGNATCKVWKYFGFYSTREAPTTKENAWNTYLQTYPIIIDDWSVGTIQLFLMINCKFWTNFEHFIAEANDIESQHCVSQSDSAQEFAVKTKVYLNSCQLLFSFYPNFASYTLMIITLEPWPWNKTIQGSMKCSFSVSLAGSSCHTMTPYYGQLSVYVSCHIKMEILLMMAQPMVLSLKNLPHPISSKYQFVKPDYIIACDFFVHLVWWARC